MILVSLGTQDKSFIRLLTEIDRLIEKKVINEKVLVQAGITKYDTENMEIFDFIPKDEFEILIREAKYIICHAGVGTILSGVLENKKVIAVPRLKKYKEHVNDHQLEIVEIFTKNDYILGCRDASELEDKIKQIDKVIFKKYETTTENLETYIENYIENIF